MNMTAVVMLTSIGMGIGIYVNWGVRAILRGLGIKEFSQLLEQVPSSE
jgi:hypothetical protein